MSGSDLASLEATVHGHVQGVFFRAFVSRHAKELNLSGCVKNLPGGAVEVVAEGKRKQLEELLGHLKVGPPAASVQRVAASWGKYSGSYSGFGISY